MNISSRKTNLIESLLNSSRIPVAFIWDLLTLYTPTQSQKFTHTHTGNWRSSYVNGVECCATLTFSRHIFHLTLVTVIAVCLLQLDHTHARTSDDYIYIDVCSDCQVKLFSFMGWWKCHYVTVCVRAWIIFDRNARVDMTGPTGEITKIATSGGKRAMYCVIVTATAINSLIKLRATICNNNRKHWTHRNHNVITLLSADMH